MKLVVSLKNIINYNFSYIMVEFSYFDSKVNLEIKLYEYYFVILFEYKKYYLYLYE